MLFIAVKAVKVRDYGCGERYLAINMDNVCATEEAGCYTVFYLNNGTDYLVVSPSYEELVKTGILPKTLDT